MSARSDQPFNIFLDPAEIQSLDSMEGVPVYDPSAVEPLPGELLLSTSWQKRLHRGFNWVGAMAPGVVLAMSMAVVGGLLADWVGKTLLGFERSPLSPVLMAVVLGLLVRNLAGLPQAYEQGLRLCLRLVLRIGVALLGLKLSITTVGMIGLNALPVVIVCIVVAIFVVSWLSRMVKLPARLGSLIAVGTSICGVSAVIATGTATRADEDEISYSVAVITLFGMIALFT
ncbi:MAG: putative sulfate exporter family transporter, partial [Opitutae bacterium]|nr:putative sulfate exporter family transporter [Opitutae bacterium]